MSRGANLKKARKAKNDEFFTQLPDIERELSHYKGHFKDKVVFCNCDDPEWSNFWVYFSRNFDHLGLKKLISTHYSSSEKTYKLEITRGNDVNGDGRLDEKDMVKTVLRSNGDFRSQECIDILQEADIVVTNAPFSLFREYIAQLIKYNKKFFLIIGNMNAISYKEIFPLIKENKIWLGITSPKEFLQPDGSVKKFGNINWYTNLTHRKRNEELILYKKYNPTDYPKYDNYDAINVDKIKDIPVDYFGVMGVPITFLGSYCPEQFEILGNSNVSGQREHLMNGIKCKTNCTYINGKPQYARILIKRKVK